MKHLFASLLTVVCFTTYAQFPSLPYNPDENGDGLIGVVDLQGLLANYGNEFASAVISEDGESAIVAMGQMQYPVCAFSCKSLPGFWEIPTLEQFGMIWDEVGTETNTNNNSTQYYVRPSNPDGNSSNYDVKVFNRYQYSYGVSGFSFSGDNIEKQCYCAAKQLPRVEYTHCNSDLAGFNECCQQRTAEGWYPLNQGPKFQSSSTTNVYSQAFWRWAE